MMDVVPPVFGNNKISYIKKKSATNVVRLEWKLPARLRAVNPVDPATVVRTKRKISKVEKSEWLTQRRDLATQVASKYPPSYREGRDISARSREATFSDLTLPPYAGGYLFGQEEAVPAKRKRQERKVRPLKPMLPMASGERDVPYSFPLAEENKKKKDIVHLVKEAGSEDVILQLPNRWWSKRAAKIEREKEARPVRKMNPLKIPSISFQWEWRPRLANLTFLLVGLIVLSVLMGNVVGVSEGLTAVKNVQGQLKEAYFSLMAGGAALAETNFDESERHFKNAEALLVEAESEVKAAAGASNQAIKYLDLTGTAKSGEKMLIAGQLITSAGQRIARGAGLLSAGKVWESDDLGDEKVLTLTDAVLGAREEFALAAAELEKVEELIQAIDNPLLPGEVREQLTQIAATLPKAWMALMAFVDQSDLLLMMLGADHDRQYLILFQNNHEIRPGGGFIGTVGLVDIDRGVVENIDVRTVYDGDGQLNELIEPPRPLKRVSDRWYLRDSNWFIDFPVNARKAAEFLEKESGPTVDGVIAMTPEVIRRLLMITGPIDMPGWGVTVDADSFWLVAQHEVTYGYDKDLNQPKRFLADLTPLLLTKLFEVKENSSLLVMNRLVELIGEKHLMLYFRNAEAQARLVKAGWSGSVPANKSGMVGVVNANIAGHKSDQFMEQEIDYDLRLQENGSVDVLLTIKREHRGPEEKPAYDYPAAENPAEKTNVIYQRTLVPGEAELIAAGGWAAERDLPAIAFENDVSEASKPDADVAEWERGQVEHESGTMIGGEAGYKFFANWVVTKPGETAVSWYKYRLPKGVKMPTVFDPAVRFETYVMKQPGVSRTVVRQTIKWPDGYRAHLALPEEGITQVNENELVYKSPLIADLLVGAVMVKE